VLDDYNVSVLDILQTLLWLSSSDAVMILPFHLPFSGANLPASTKLGCSLLGTQQVTSIRFTGETCALLTLQPLHSVHHSDGELPYPTYELFVSNLLPEGENYFSKTKSEPGLDVY
jgi:hypothetical protein